MYKSLFIIFYWLHKRLTQYSITTGFDRSLAKVNSQEFFYLKISEDFTPRNSRKSQIKQHRRWKWVCLGIFQGLTSAQFTSVLTKFLFKEIWHLRANMKFSFPSYLLDDFNPLHVSRLILKLDRNTGNMFSLNFLKACGIYLK